MTRGERESGRNDSGVGGGGPKGKVGETTRIPTQTVPRQA